MNRPGRTYIIEEDEHLQNLRKIIKRDFFSSGENEKSDTIQLSLNEYISNFKSNQNKIFSQLVEADKQKWRKQHWWFQNQDRLLMVEKEKLQAIKNQSHQYQNMIQKIQPKDNKLAITGQEAKNSIFFNRDKNYGSYLEEESQAAKKINYKNCRFKTEEEKHKENLQQQKDSDSEGEENPITWGQVEATPLRISEETQYRIPERPDKDVLLDKLNRKISKSKIDGQKSVRKSELMMKIMGSSTPGYKNSSYVRTSSIKRVNAPSTPRNQEKVQQIGLQMKGLLNFEK